MSDQTLAVRSDDQSVTTANGGEGPESAVATIEADQGDPIAGAFLTHVHELPSAMYEARVAVEELEQTFPDLGEFPKSGKYVLTGDVVIYYAIANFTHRSRPHADADDATRRTVLVATDADTGDVVVIHAASDDWSAELASLSDDRQVVVLDLDVNADAPMIAPEQPAVADRAA